MKRLQHPKNSQNRSNWKSIEIVKQSYFIFLGQKVNSDDSDGENSQPLLIIKIDLHWSQKH